MEIHVQLLPFSENGLPISTLDIIERKLKDGYTITLGRQVIKDGAILTKTNGHGLDIWFNSKVVSRIHAELWAKDGQLYIKDVGSSSGTFLNRMRLSPSGKGSRPYPLKDSDVLQFGVDYKGKTEVVLKVLFADQLAQFRKKTFNPVKFQSALKTLLAATNPYSISGSVDDSTGTTECCICINSIAPYQALFISPCSHCFHYKCVSGILSQTTMFPCPMCRQIANLTASVSTESLSETETQTNNNGSDSDISVTVDELGKSVCSESQALTPSKDISTNMDQSQTSHIPSPLSQIPNQRNFTQEEPSEVTTPSQSLSQHLSTFVRVQRPSSADDSKKSLAMKISTFLHRKTITPSNNSPSPNSSVPRSDLAPETQKPNDSPLENKESPVYQDQE